MNNLKQKARSTGIKAAERIKKLPEDAKSTVKAMPQKTKALAVRTADALNEMQRRTRVKLIIAVVAIILVILVAGGILNGGHLWYAKKL